jgi:hypothetical protein
VFSSLNVHVFTAQTGVELHYPAWAVSRTTSSATPWLQASASSRSYVAVVYGEQSVGQALSQNKIHLRFHRPSQWRVGAYDLSYLYLKLQLETLTRIDAAELHTS